MAALERETQTAIFLAREAGRVVMEVYATEFAVVHKPKGEGPVTAADERANRLLVTGLRQAFPGDGVIAEESADPTEAARCARCWYVDPVDGTTEFVDRTGMFAIHVGLAIDGEPRVGVVYAPATGRLYVGVVGEGGYVEEGGSRQALAVAPTPARTSDLRLVVSRAHRSRLTEEIRQALGITATRELGSVGLKCGVIAEGQADLYLHPSDRSSAWDACAPEAVLKAAGGVLTDFAGRPYRYGASELRNRRGLLGCGAQTLPWVLPIVQPLAEVRGLLARPTGEPGAT